MPYMSAKKEISKGPHERARVIKSVGGFHNVCLENGCEVIARARGRLKRKGTILVGDMVEVAVEGDGGVIENVFPRITEFVRPAVANVDLVAAVVSLSRPEPPLELLDRILALAELAGVEICIVWNKVDLVNPEGVEEVTSPYRDAGYPVLFTSAVQGQGVDELARSLAGHVTVFAGPSGAGKSSLLNALVPDSELETQEVSHKISRGRHTTRHVSLLPLDGGGWVADSPGFSTLSLGTVDPRLLPGVYREFARYEAGCRFSGCLHRLEPACAVREAHADGKVDKGRYERYLKLLEEAEEAFARRY